MRIKRDVVNAPVDKVVDLQPFCVNCSYCKVAVMPNSGITSYNCHRPNVCLVTGKSIAPTKCVEERKGVNEKTHCGIAGVYYKAK